MKDIMALLFLGCILGGCINPPANKIAQDKSDNAQAQQAVGPSRNCPSGTSDGDKNCQIFSWKAKGVNTPIDLLWVIDNSSTMLEEQNLLADDFEALLDGFKTQNVDFRMAIVTTDNSVNHNTGRTLDASYLSSDRQGFIEQFQNQIKVGNRGSQVQCGLNKSLDFVQTNRSWMRPDALLVAVYVSVDNDHSSGGNGVGLSCVARQGNRIIANTSDSVVANSYFNSLAGYKGSQYFFKAFPVVIMPARSGKSPPYDEYRGHRYLQLAQMTNGESYDIINDSFDTILQNIGQRLAEFSSSFQLKYPADPHTIEVYIDGVPSPQSHWRYLRNNNSVSFEDNASPRVGSQIKIIYKIKYDNNYIQASSGGGGRAPGSLRPMPLPSSPRPPYLSPTPQPSPPSFSPSPSPSPSPSLPKVCGNKCPSGWSGPGPYKQGCQCTPPPTCKNKCMKGQIGPGPYPGCMCTEPPKCKNACPYGYKGPSGYPTCACTPPPPRSPSAIRICSNVCPRGYTGPGPYPNCRCTPPKVCTNTCPSGHIGPGAYPGCTCTPPRVCTNKCPTGFSGPGSYPGCACKPQSICINKCPSGYSGPRRLAEMPM